MATQITRTRPSSRLTLRDRLSRLTFDEAGKLLGPSGKALIQQSANLWSFDLQEDVYLGATCSACGSRASRAAASRWS